MTDDDSETTCLFAGRFSRQAGRKYERRETTSEKRVWAFGYRVLPSYAASVSSHEQTGRQVDNVSIQSYLGQSDIS